MKVYTYYDRIRGFTCQLDVIKLWEETWSRQGFEPVVLCENDAKIHPYYDEYKNYICALHEEIVGKPIDHYGISCYMRWLAYAATGEKEMYTSDYDVLNFSLKPESFDTYMIHLMMAGTPCLVAASAERFEQLCHIFVESMIENIVHLKDAVKNQLWLHDQEMLSEFLYNGSLDERTEFVNTNNLLVNYDFEKYVKDWEGIETAKNTPCVHYSHNAMHTQLPVLRNDESPEAINKFELFCTEYNLNVVAGKIIPPDDIQTKLQFNFTPNWSGNYQKNLHQLRLIVMQTDIKNV